MYGRSIHGIRPARRERDPAVGRSGGLSREARSAGPQGASATLGYGLKMWSPWAAAKRHIRRTRSCSTSSYLETVWARAIGPRPRQPDLLPGA